MGKIKELREIIIKANPEIVELKFGCRLKNKYQSDDNPYQIKTFIKKSGKLYKCREFDGRDFHSEPDTFEIIGRPITLVDVLKSMQGKSTKCIGVDMNGYFLNTNLQATDLIQLDDRWDLSKDLDNQPKETLTFLHNLLCLKQDE